MKKSFLAIILVTATMFSMFACGKREAPQDETQPQTSLPTTSVSEAVINAEEETTQVSATSVQTTAAVSTQGEAEEETEAPKDVSGMKIKAKIDGVTYTFDGDSKTLYVSGKDIKSVNLKSEDEYFEEWEIWEKYTEKVVVKFGAVSIGNGAFEDYYSLKHIELPATLNKIDDGFLDGTENLETISLASLNFFFTVENDVLYNKNKTKLIHYPANRNAESFVFPNTVEEMHTYAFWDADNLKEITISPKLTPNEKSYIWFKACDSLEKIIVPEESESFASDSQGLFCNKEMTKIILIPAGIKVLNVPDSVSEEITYYDFAHECILDKIIIGENTQISKWLLQKELLIRDVEVKENSKYYSSEDGIIYNKDKTELLWYPSDKTDKKLVIRNTVKSVEYLKNKNLEEIVLSDSVETVNKSAFWGCENLKRVHFGKNMSEIIYDDEFDVEYMNPFAYHENFEKITVAAGNKHFKVDSQGALYTYDMKKLITVPVKSNIEEFVIPDSVDIILDCFKNCAQIKKIHFGSGVEGIAIGTADTETIVGFDGCTSLESVSVSKNNKNYTSADGILFSKDMKRLYLYPANKAGERYIVPKHVEIINDYAFFDNQNLKMVYVYENTYEYAAFSVSENHGRAFDIYYERTEQSEYLLKNPRYHFNAKGLPQ